MKSTGSVNLSKSREECFHTATNTLSKDLSNCAKPCQNDTSKESAWKCRYAITIIGFLIYLSVSIHRTILSVVIVAMVNNTAINRNSKAKSESCLDLIPNTTEDATTPSFKSEGVFIWSPETQGYILGSFYLGTILTLMPAGRLVERYGCKWIIVGSLLTKSILTMLIPPFARFSAFAMIVIQTLRGLVQGMILPCVSILIANWSPKTERGFLYSLIHPAVCLGAGLGCIFAGYVSESSEGWPNAFYSVGGSGILLTIYILFFVAESPKEHPRISKAELNFILSQQESKLSRRRPELPWRQMLRSVPLYAYVFTMFGRYWMSSQFWIVHSTFLGTILHYPIEQNGLFSAIPFFLSFLMGMVSSWISGYIEKAEIVSVNFLRKFWTFISSFLYSLFLLGVYAVGCNRDISAIFSILSMGAVGLGTPGYFTVIQDMSPTFAGTLFSIISTIGFMASVILPLVVGYLTDEIQTLEQWNKIFFISIGVVMSSAIVFAVFGSAKIQPWNFVHEKNGKKEENHKNDQVTNSV